MKISRSFFAALLRFFPASFRARFGDGMLETFEERFRERSARGGLALAGFLVRTAANAIREGLRERLFPTAFDGSWSDRSNRRMGWRGMMGVLMQDLRFALRALARRPGFTLIAVTTLALGVGANTAIFSVVNGVLLRPLPYPEPEGIVTIDVAPSGPAGRPGSMSYPDILDLAEVPALETLVGVNPSNLTLTGLGEPEVIPVIRLTAGLMETFRITPALGRDIRADEFGPGGPAIIVLSYGFWHGRFGGDADVLGKTVTLNGLPYEVVGVAPAGFGYPGDAQLWIPRNMDPESCSRGCHTMRTIGRLAGASTVEAADGQVDGIAQSLEAAYPETNTGKRFLVRSLQDQMVGRVRQGLWLILGAVGVVLLIACANVANLLLVRASTRTGEIAVRSALGASRGRLVTQVLVESGVIATLGGLAGLALAALGIRLLPAFAAGGIPRIDAIAIDGPVLLFTLGTVVIVTLLFGGAPAWTLARTSLRAGLGQGSSGAGEKRGSGRLRGLLLGGEVALSAVLLVGAGLLLQSFARLYAVDVGFETREILRFNLSLPRARYESLTEVQTFYRTLEARIRVLPGVEAAGSVWGPPLGRGNATGTVYVEGRPDPTPLEETDVAVHPVGPGWLETMRIPVLRGRGLTAADDDASAEPVAVVNETFVRENFPNEDPIGQTVRTGVSLGYAAPSWRIVGIVGDVRSRTLEMEAESQMYMPHGHYGPESMSITIRGAAGAPPLLGVIREEVRKLDADLPLYRVETVEEALARQVAPTRFYLVLVGLFAGLAAGLAAVGLYGVVAYSVSRRTREIGLRVALGARKEGIIGLVLGQGMRPAVLGLFAGLGLAFLGGRVMEALLFGVEPRSPLIFGATGILLTIVTLAAATLPAYRASRVDPVIALRSE